MVGTGPAGAVIAKTLTDDKKTSVLVLEAGENNDTDQPIRDSRFAPELEEHFFPEYFWRGEGVPQEGVDDRSFEWTTGRLSGGGSSINGEQYVRPTSAVLREWERLLGSSWSPEQAIKNFKQLEHFHGKTNTPDIHGFSDRLSIRQTPRNPPAIKAIYKTYIKYISEKLSKIDPSYQFVSPTLETINNDKELERRGSIYGCRKQYCSCQGSRSFLKNKPFVMFK